MAKYETSWVRNDWYPFQGGMAVDIIMGGMYNLIIQAELSSHFTVTRNTKHK